MSGISEQYIREFFEKKERKSPMVVKTRYGKALDDRFVINEKAAKEKAEWIARRAGGFQPSR
ncbi:MAG: hypothetical protein WCW14_00620 [Candidatus Paceibacterota bacterium]|jgi:hypothetical protein